MVRRIFLSVLIACLASITNQPAFGNDGDDGWISLFDERTLNGWKASENKSTFSVRDGMIVAQGRRSHLYYVGPVENANFRDFEFKADVMTKPGANS